MAGELKKRLWDTVIDEAHEQLYLHKMRRSNAAFLEDEKGNWHFVKDLEDAAQCIERLNEKFDQWLASA